MDFLQQNIGMTDNITTLEQEVEKFLEASSQSAIELSQASQMPAANPPLATLAQTSMSSGPGLMVTSQGQPTTNTNTPQIFSLVLSSDFSQPSVLQQQIQQPILPKLQAVTINGGSTVVIQPGSQLQSLLLQGMSPQQQATYLQQPQTQQQQPLLQQHQQQQQQQAQTIASISNPTPSIQYENTLAQTLGLSASVVQNSPTQQIHAIRSSPTNLSNLVSSYVSSSYVSDKEHRRASTGSVKSILQAKKHGDFLVPQVCQWYHFNMSSSYKTFHTDIRGR